MKSYLQQYEKQKTYLIGKRNRLTSLLTNLLSNYKHKKSTEEWIREKVTQYEHDILENTINFLEKSEYLSFDPSSDNVIIHDREKVKSTTHTLKESPKLLKQWVKAFFSKKQ